MKNTRKKLNSFKLSRTSFGKKALNCSKAEAMAIDKVADSDMQVDQGSLSIVVRILHLVHPANTMQIWKYNL